MPDMRSGEGGDMSEEAAAAGEDSRAGRGGYFFDDHDSIYQHAQAE